MKTAKALPACDPLALKWLLGAFWEFNKITRTFSATIAGQPKAKQRARHGQGRTYRIDRADEDALAWHLSSSWRRPASLEPFALVAIFYRSTLRAFDTDNAMKLVKDAGNGVAWVDDSQVRAELGLLELDRENPRTVVVWGEREGS